MPKTKGDNRILKVMEKVGYKITKFGPLLGNKAIYTYYPDNDFKLKEGGEDFFDKAFFDGIKDTGFKLYDYGTECEGVETIAVPSISYIKDILKESLELCEIISEHKKISKDIIVSQTDLNDYLLEIFREVIEWDDESDEFEYHEDIRRYFDTLADRLWDMLGHPSRDLIALILKTVPNIYSFSEVVYKSYN